jgi:hypothetical protein
MGIENLRIGEVSTSTYVGKGERVILKTEVSVSCFRHRRHLRVVHEGSNRWEG